MKTKHPIKRPDWVEVRGVRVLIYDPPSYWSENQHSELFCDRCQQPLVVLFGARTNPDVSPEDPRWWVPTALVCSCLLPKTVELQELPRRPRRGKRDARQLEIPNLLTITK